MNNPKPKFNIGDRVSAIALPNAIPSPRDATPGMIVESRRLTRTTNPRDTFPSYWRYQAYLAADPWIRIEGSERFFAAENKAPAPCV